MLGEDVDFLHDVSIELEPEHGLIAGYGMGDTRTPALTEFGVPVSSPVGRQRQWQLIPMYLEIRHEST
jgi:hypothetical protein